MIHINFNQIKKALIKNCPKLSLSASLVGQFLKNKKDHQKSNIMQVSIPTLHCQFISTLINYDLLLIKMVRIYNQKQEQNQLFQHSLFHDGSLELDSFDLSQIEDKNAKDILQCLVLRKKKNRQTVITVRQNKLHLFFKKIKNFYKSFLLGDKLVLPADSLREFYQEIKKQVRPQKKMTAMQLVNFKINRNLKIIVIVMENKIMQGIDQVNRKRQIRNNRPDNLFVKKHKSENQSLEREIIQNNSIKFQPSYKLSKNLSHRAILSKLQIEPSYEQINYEICDSKCESCSSIEQYEQQNEQQSLVLDKINLLSNDVQNIVIKQAFQKFRCRPRRKYSHDLYEVVDQTQSDSSNPSISVKSDNMTPWFQQMPMNMINYPFNNYFRYNDQY